MRLTQLQPLHDHHQLVGWTARFKDEAGQVRIATVGLGCLLDPAAFAEAVSRQGVRYLAPGGADHTAWRSLVRGVTAWQPRQAS